jgi:hypothetical protein
MVVHAYNPSTQEAEAGGELQVTLGYIIRSFLQKKKKSARNDPFQYSFKADFHQVLFECI